MLPPFDAKAKHLPFTVQKEKSRLSNDVLFIANMHTSRPLSVSGAVVQKKKSCSDLDANEKL